MPSCACSACGLVWLFLVLLSSAAQVCINGSAWSVLIRSSMFLWSCAGMRSYWYSLCNALVVLLGWPYSADALDLLWSGLTLVAVLARYSAASQMSSVLLIVCSSNASSMVGLRKAPGLLMIALYCA